MKIVLDSTSQKRIDAKWFLLVPYVIALRDILVSDYLCL